MAKFNEENKRRESTKRRYNGVHDAYSLVMEELGDLADAVSRHYVYEKIKEKTGLCVKTIAYVLNHTERE